MEGIVKTISKKTKGVKIGDTWYDATKVWDFSKNLQKGDEVDFRVEDGKLTFIRKEESIEEPRKIKKTVQSEDLIVRENVLRTTVEYLKLTSDRPQTPEDVLKLAEKFEKWIRYENPDFSYKKGGNIVKVKETKNW
jgi:hypothetical protein